MSLKKKVMELCTNYTEVMPGTIQQHLGCNYWHIFARVNGLARLSYCPLTSNIFQHVLQAKKNPSEAKHNKMLPSTYFTVVRSMEKVTVSCLLIFRATSMPPIVASLRVYSSRCDIHSPQNVRGGSWLESGRPVSQGNFPDCVKRGAASS